MANKFTTSTSTAKALKDPVPFPSRWQLDYLRSRIQKQCDHMASALPQLKPRRSDIAATTKRKSNGSHYLKSFNSDPTAGSIQVNIGKSQCQQKNTQQVQKKVMIKKSSEQSKSRVKPQKGKETNGTGKAKKKSHKSQRKVSQQKLQSKQRPKQSKPQQRNQQKFQQKLDEEQKLGLRKNIGFASNLNSKKPLELRIGLNSHSENNEIDFDGFFWKVAERRLEANRMLLLEARSDLAALRIENQKLRSVLLSTKRQGEKYKRQLENEVFKKLINETDLSTES